jgi:hypothetical protein
MRNILRISLIVKGGGGLDGLSYTRARSGFLDIAVGATGSGQRLSGRHSPLSKHRRKVDEELLSPRYEDEFHPSRRVATTHRVVEGTFASFQRSLNTTQRLEYI